MTCTVWLRSRWVQVVLVGARMSVAVCNPVCACVVVRRVQRSAAHPGDRGLGV